MFTYSEFKYDDTKSVCPYEEPISREDTVKVNGQDVPVYTCRISKYPFNRVWPGEQRPANQTELASFVNLVSDEEITLEVTVNRSYEKIMIKPYSKGIEFSDENGKITFTLKNNGHYVLEADSYHHCLYIFNSKPAERPKESDVTYYFGAGIHMVGKITLKDHDRVYVDKDALVFGCIYAENAKNIRIFGNGILDDTAEGRIDTYGHEQFTNGNVKFFDCEALRIEGVLLRNSAIWCVNIFHCTDVVLDDIKVFGQWRYNTDGVDIVNSRDITVKNSFIHSFDDTVTIKGIDRYIDTDNENILIENCELWCDWGRACEIGIETACRRYRNIVFRNCDVLRAGGVALDIQNGDFAEISDILFENIHVEYNSFDTPELYQKTDDMTYNVENEIAIPYLISISNARWRTAKNHELLGIPMEYPEGTNTEGIECGGVHDITYRNITVYYDEKMPKRDGAFNIPVRTLTCVEGVRYYHLTVENVRVRWLGELYPLELSL